MPLTAGNRKSLENCHDIVFDGKLPENRGLLRQITNAEPRALVHRHRADVLAVEQDSAFLRLDEPDNHIECGRLPGSVGSEKPHYFPLLEPQVDVVNHCAAAIGLHESLRFENAAAWESAGHFDRLQSGILARVSEDLRDLAAIWSDVVPQRLRHRYPYLAGLQLRIYLHDRSVAGETRQH